ncbi:MAG: hypothetical protein KAQ68_06330 [Clostridiales bacterium]|nr:hypothetical protein [Clostridiales bacterium]
MKSSKQQLSNRGYIKDYELTPYEDYTKQQLINMLKSCKATERTIAARLIVKFKDVDTIDALISALISEKKLYTKIALSESLGECGAPASSILIEHLGKIGNNQHKQLPDKPFGKNNYPLPRDIIARTICKIGKPAIPSLRECLNSGEYIQVLEAVDAVGFISYYENDSSATDDIMHLFLKYENANLMIWKLLRCLQSFNDTDVISLLQKYLVSDIKQLKWEATRSLEQIIQKQGSDD